MPSSTSTVAQLTQLRKLTSSPTMTPNAVSGFTVTPSTVSFALASSVGVASIDLLSSPYADPSTAHVAATWGPQSSFAFPTPTTSLSGKLFFWVRLNPQGTSGSPALVGPQSITL